MKTHEGEFIEIYIYHEMGEELNVFSSLTHTGEPTEECMRCGKMYILTADVNKGLCGRCLGIPCDQMSNSQFRSSGESGTEEESSNGGTEFSDSR